MSRLHGRTEDFLPVDRYAVVASSASDEVCRPRVAIGGGAEPVEGPRAIVKTVATLYVDNTAQEGDEALRDGCASAETVTHKEGASRKEGTTHLPRLDAGRLRVHAHDSTCIPS